MRKPGSDRGAEGVIQRLLGQSDAKVLVVAVERAMQVGLLVHSALA